ncbi:MAG: threonine synthase [Gemmatimonadota bacterium]|nr:threonine synthase [Gemmatimonadota bacterium]
MHPRPAVFPVPTGHNSGVWRFGDLVMPGASTPVSWPEGRTPLVEREAVRSYANVGQLWMKHEGMNPTGSFKDRGMTAAVTDAVRSGATAVACASTGNTSASLGAYASMAGLRALVFVPQGKVALGKLAQATAYGAKTLAVRGDFDAALDLARAASRQLGVYLANSINPWRIEGQKTIAWELLEQLDWNVPEWIALPAGALGNTSAFGKALREARALGRIARVPRLLAVQASGAAPFATAFAERFSRRVTVSAETAATAIRIGNPASWDRGVRAIRETDGVVVAVSDGEILDAKAVIDAAGIGCEPASAASVAGVKALRAQGTIGPDDRVACVLTGHLLKDPDAVVAYHAGGSRLSNPPVEIEPDLRAVARILEAR